jgi:hypothetical protein
MGNYIEQSIYNDADNILTLKHLGSDPVNPGWTRNYNNNKLSQLEPVNFSNRLSSTVIGSTTETYGYDADGGTHGNITSMPYLSSLS